MGKPWLTGHLEVVPELTIRVSVATASHSTVTNQPLYLSSKSAGAIFLENAQVLKLQTVYISLNFVCTLIFSNSGNFVSGASFLKYPSSLANNDNHKQEC